MAVRITILFGPLPTFLTFINEGVGILNVLYIKSCINNGTKYQIFIILHYY